LLAQAELKVRLYRNSAIWAGRIPAPPSCPGCA